MAFWSALRRRPEEEDYSEAFDEYDYEDDYSYENTTPSWGNEAAAQPIRSAADMQVALVIQIGRASCRERVYVLV